ncbi:enoyl-CoA hydratase/isomerase family protein [Nisaea acidiphila]|uniref:3-hydroxyisobutyryl-CoA hydrolase n=1 Tax=Nisaea acidiphila TaxID=1862145 RepID=A0A9J7ASX9_9PROT|nr:enoyl-CoA hydratase/isomerase family protein [Nisaea acidiphila]UUX50391.1 enoyl-CoA hydratase/isomerase family protein [Nisaea acidiphila]
MTEEVRFEIRGGFGCITLDRQRALNALTLEIIRAMQVQIDAWAEDPKVGAILVEGAGERAFCAGGDVVAVRRSRLEEGSDGGATPQFILDFFGEEYRLNRTISELPKPYIALLDGVTMGGGVGISVHGDFRIVTDRTLFAMPETGIGLFPDVGGGWFLPRCPGETGTYLALTGTPVKAADCLYVGAATHYVPSDGIDALRDALTGIAVVDDMAGAIGAVLAEFAAPAGDAPLAAHRDVIDRAFGGDSIEEILGALKETGGAFATETAELLGTRSPTSLKMTLELMRRGARCASLAEDLEMEFALVQSFMTGADFFEGVRALLVEKDRNPKWSPADLSGVGPEQVEAFFARDGKAAL